MRISNSAFPVDRPSACVPPGPRQAALGPRQPGPGRRGHRDSDHGAGHGGGRGAAQRQCQCQPEKFGPWLLVGVELELFVRASLSASSPSDSDSLLGPEIP